MFRHLKHFKGDLSQVFCVNIVFMLNQNCLHSLLVMQKWHNSPSVSSSSSFIDMSIIHRKWSCTGSCDRSGWGVPALLLSCLLSSLPPPHWPSQAILPIACWFIHLFTSPLFLVLSMRLDEFSWHCFRHPSNLCAVILTRSMLLQG